MRATYEKKQVLTKFRSRNRDLWSDQEIMHHNAEHREDNVYKIHDDGEVLDQYSFEQKHHTLSPRKNANLVRKLHQVDSVTNKLHARLAPTEEFHGTTSNEQPLSPATITFTVAVTTVDELDKARSIIEQDELAETTPPNNSFQNSTSAID